MKIFTKKGILQKTILVILTILLMNFMVPTYSHADLGGVLMDPISDLLCTIGDVVINVLQRCLNGDWGAGFSLNGGFLVESSKFFDSTSEYKHMWSDEEGEIIKPYDENNGFNKTLFTGSTQDFHIPIANYSPEQIFAGKVSGLDINFIDPNFDNEYEKAGIFDKKDSEGYKLDDNGNKIPLSSAARLQPTIAKWYVALRNLTIVGLLSVLVYVGIRIIISSTASDKAKYKQMLMDWLVALCLVFFLHYIMSFTLTLTQSICEAISGTGEETVIITVENEDGTDKDSFKTNLLGAARFKTQYDDLGQKVTYLIMYLALVIYTVMFSWFYLKRLLMMAFLTLIAPVVALTYPIDKISDGKAQAFDTWLKEYIFNALIQPFHLIIYTVFVGSAMDLASSNIIYTIAALAFIMPAEKILRKFFGFEKAGAGTLGSLVGGAALGSMAGKAIKSLGGKGGSGGKDSGGKNESEENKPPRFENKHDVAQIEGPEGADINNSNVVENKLEDNNHDVNPFEGLNDNELNEKSIDDRMAELENTDYNYAYNPEYLDLQQRKQQMEAGKQQSQLQQPKESEQQDKEVKNNKFKIKNWTRAHNMNWGSAYGLGKRTIGKVGRFATKTAFKAGAGTLAGAVALASGSGLGGAITAASVASTLGGNLGNKFSDAVGGMYNLGESAVKKGVGVAGAIKNGTSVSEELLGGTALGREIDLGKGNTRYQDAAKMKEIKTNKDNVQYVKDYMTAQNGYVPSAKEVRDKMNSFDPYLAEGLTEIKDMLKAQKAEIYTGSAKQAAIIAAIGKEKGITADILNDEKKANAQQANLKQEFVNKGYSEAVAAKQADYTMNVLKVQQGVAHNLKKPQLSEQSQQPKQEKPPRTKK